MIIKIIWVMLEISILFTKPLQFVKFQLLIKISRWIAVTALWKKKDLYIYLYVYKEWEKDNYKTKQ